ncbi:hypothetical protein [Cryobacterium aureum]|uniref:hypothetical protein n=1 Tax=Cryobacterium aureum TaxID=995037 RepID=UPI000CF57C11|nr:hypothetical protein [Cryobacterium aureum]
MSLSVNSAASIAGLTPSRTSAPRSTGVQPADKLMSLLTASDREIVYQATGRRVDDSSSIVSMFAVEIALDRQSGYLSAGQEVSPAYLQLMATKYAGDEYSQSFGVAIGNALSYLAGQAPRTGIDVTA